MNFYCWNDARDRAKIIEILKHENCVAGSSDTVIGLLANTTKCGALLLNEIKGRQNKPYIILIESPAQALDFVHEKDLIPYQKLMTELWPGPFTLIFKAKESLPEYIKGAQGTVALRVPKHEGLLAILSHFKGLFSTSANKAGFPVPASIDQIDPAIATELSAIIKESDTIQKLSEHHPSTILDCTGSEPKIIRLGADSKKN